MNSNFTEFLGNVQESVSVVPLQWKYAGLEAFNLITLVTWLLRIKKTLLPYNRFSCFLIRKMKYFVIEEFGNYDGFTVAGSIVLPHPPAPSML